MTSEYLNLPGIRCTWILVLMLITDRLKMIAGKVNMTVYILAYFHYNCDL